MTNAIKSIRPGDLVLAASTPQAFPVGSAVVVYFGGNWYPGAVAEHVRGGRSIGVRFSTGSGRERTSRVSVVHLESVLAEGGHVPALRVAPAPGSTPATSSTPASAPAARVAPTPAQAEQPTPLGPRARGPRRQAAELREATSQSAGVQPAALAPPPGGLGHDPDLDAALVELDAAQGIDQAAEQAVCERVRYELDEADAALFEASPATPYQRPPLREGAEFYLRVEFEQPLPGDKASQLAPWLTETMAGWGLKAQVEVIQGNTGPVGSFLAAVAAVGGEA